MRRVDPADLGQQQQAGGRQDREERRAAALKRVEFLREFLSLDGRLFRALEPEPFRRCF
jgi:hypothetical protein